MQQSSRNDSSHSSQGSSETTRQLMEGSFRAICLTVEVFLHRGFGSRYVSGGFLGVIVIYLFSLMFNPQDISPLLGFAFVYLIVWLITTLCVLIRYCRGKDKMHAKYTGRPILWRLLPGWKEDKVKHLEAVIVIAAGYGVHYLNAPLGCYIMTAAVVLLLRNYARVSELRRRAVDMNDKVIEQNIVAEHFRAMQEQ
jgi:hypothetical protein